MSQSSKQTVQWAKPELVRLGTIKDVAGPNALAAQSPIQTRS